ncbi:MAG: DsbE family thiol:disulfide interchange protein [Burkholderiaceae bacterium]
MRALKTLIPLLLFVVIAVFLYRGLSKDPRLIPSPLIDKPAPTFSLPRLDNGEPWSPQAMAGKVWLLNVWGSWCAACVVEHPLISELARDGRLPVVGLAWKDRPQASRAWLERHGNPYEVVISDLPGSVAIDFGVYGAPESFLIDKRGQIRYKQVGPFDQAAIDDTLLPLVQRLRAE